VSVRLECRVLGPRLFFFIWSSSFSWGSLCQAGPHAMTVRLGPRALGQSPPCLITSRGTVQDSHRPLLRVRDPWTRAPCSGEKGSSPRVLESVKKGLCPCQRGLSYRGGDHTGYVCWGGSAPKPGLERIGVRYSRTFLLRARGCLWLYPVKLYHGRRGPLGTRQLSWRSSLGERPDHVRYGQTERFDSLVVEKRNLVQFASKSSSF
jgi:hypothetical protein